MVTTRPDIAYTVSKLASQASNPAPEHLTAVKRVYRYLAGTSGHCLTCSPSHDHGPTPGLPPNPDLQPARAAWSASAMLIGQDPILKPHIEPRLPVLVGQRAD